MEQREKILQILRDEYGITTERQLFDAMNKQKSIDISIFVGRNEKNGRKNRAVREPEASVCIRA